jgi:DNA-binding response OmpR family regulator
MEGADDYITKPFYGAEVVARVKTVLRRSGKPNDPQRYVFPKIGLMVDRVTKEVTLDDQVIQLTQKEFELLNLLAKHAPSIVNYPTLTRSIWDEESDNARKRAKYLVYLLRRKFQKASPQKKLIVNVDRLGYKLVVE